MAATNADEKYAADLFYATAGNLEKPIRDGGLVDKNPHSIYCNTLIYNTFSKSIIKINHGGTSKNRVMRGFLRCP